MLENPLTHSEPADNESSKFPTRPDDDAVQPQLTQYGILIDGVEFRRREHLMPAKAARLSTEDLAPIENLTFSEIANCSRDQRKYFARSIFSS
jgi:hypothetical protein